MTLITYIEPAGEAVTVDVSDGWSLMQAAIADGIVGECGGSCAGATCHCYVDEARLPGLPRAVAGRTRDARQRGCRAEAEPPAGLPAQGRSGPRRAGAQAAGDPGVTR
jgi:2Fe-2S ferredoxin